MRELTSWREILEEKLQELGETWADIEFIAGEGALDEKFDSGYGGTEGLGITIWTSKNVLFPLCYDGAEWLGSIPRHPQETPSAHQGGG